MTTTTVHRRCLCWQWCVTGTPITSHGLNDVRSLLHVPPQAERLRDVPLVVLLHVSLSSTAQINLKQVVTTI